MYLSLRRWKLLGLCGILFFGVATAEAQQGEDAQPKKLPTNEILVKGPWSSASDSVTSLPEGGSLADGGYTNQYFGITYAPPPGWIQKYSGPPPSSSGYYVLAQIGPSDAATGPGWGSILVAAQDLFFTLTPAANAPELIEHAKDNLSADYKVDRAPTTVSIADHPFVRFDYDSPAAGLHWSVLATQIRCHVIQFVFTGRDTQSIESLIRGMNAMKLPMGADPISGFGGGDVPVCIADYARGENVIHRVDPVFTGQKFNAIPVRIVIGKDGNVKHIHFLSAFPDEASSITDALWQWKFKPYIRDGQAAEVETGLMFGHAPRGVTPPATKPVEQR